MNLFSNELPRKTTKTFVSRLLHATKSLFRKQLPQKTTGTIILQNLSERVTIPSETELETQLRNVLDTYTKQKLVRPLLEKLAGKYICGQNIIETWKNEAQREVDRIDNINVRAQYSMGAPF